MSRLIDVTDLIKSLPYVDVDNDEKISKVGAMADFVCMILDRPIIDAVPVVRCKDCIHATMTLDNKLCKFCDLEMDEYSNQVTVYHEADYYCADGERKVSE